MQTADIAKLSLAERLAAMEALWDSLSHDPNHEPSPAWHAAVLEQRRRELGQGRAIPWDEAKQHLRSISSKR